MTDVAGYMRTTHGVNSVEIVDAYGNTVSDSRSHGFEEYLGREVKTSVVAMRSNNEVVATLVIRAECLK